MVLPEIDVPLIDAASAPGKGSTIRAMASVDGAALASPQLFRLRALLVIVVLEMTSWGALACSVMPGDEGLGHGVAVDGRVGDTRAGCVIGDDDLADVGPVGAELARPFR